METPAAPLKRWEARLPAALFVRVHRSTIVNTRFVAGIVATTSNTYEVRLAEPHAPVHMSRRYAARLKERMAPTYDA